MNLVLALLILGAALYAVTRKIDVRLVLLLAALALAFVAGIGRAVAADTGRAAAFAAAPMQIIRTFLITFSNEKFIVPICSAMGFAYVLRETQCDKHLIHLLMKPFQQVRPLLIPGTILVAFCANIPLVSQTSTVVAVGTVMVPLLRAAGIPNLTLGAALVFGASVGGELLNPAAPELQTVSVAMRPFIPDASPQMCIERVWPLVWKHLLVGMIVFWLHSLWADRKKTESVEPATTTGFRVNILKALVPFIPLAILFVTGPPLNLLKVPKEWLTTDKDVASFDARMIGAAMLVGVLTATLIVPSAFKKTVAAFFDGAGYGYTHIVALIVTANCFGDGIKLIGLDRMVGQLISASPGLLIPFAAALPLGFACLSGSGMAATQSLFEFFVGPIQQTGSDPFHVGAVVSIGSAAGRTMSPVAAATLMCAKMTDTEPFSLARRIALPILVGMVVVVILAMI